MNAASPVIGPWKPIVGLSQPALAAAVAAGAASARANAEATIASDAMMSTATRQLPSVSFRAFHALLLIAQF